MGKKKILLVDDDADFVEATKVILESKSYDISIAHDGQEGLEKVRTERPDLIILDVMMPNMDGYEVCAKLKADPACSRIPVLLLTAVGNAIPSSKYTKEMGMRMEADDYIPKPVEAEAFLDLKGHAGLGQPFQDHIKNKVVVEMITKLMIRDNPYQAEEICLMDTGDKRVRVHVNPVKDAHEALLGTVTLLHDVAQLSAIDKIKSNFLAMVSHQLKSPLSSTLLQTSILLDGMVGEMSEKQRDLIQKIKAKIRGMTDLVNDVLDVCFIEEGAYVAQIEALNLPEILQRTVELMQPQSHDKNIGFQVSIDEDLPLITGNRSSIEAMFINLISNAIKYTPANGQFHVHMMKKAQHIQIEISDTGLGIEAKDIPHIFEKFSRERP